MQEIFDALPRTTKRGLVLLDTCFVIYCFEHHAQDELIEAAKLHRLAMTSFNVLELVHVLKKLKDKSVKERVRSFFKENKGIIKILELPVRPGERDKEKEYVQTIDPFLAQDIPDPSDAVLVAAAVQSGSVVVTKDKHDLFTVVLENYIHRWGLKVVKSLKDL